MTRSVPRSGRPRDPALDARIVDATRALIRESGLDALTIAAVAARADVGRPAVYRRYPDREALIMGVLMDDLDVVLARTLVEVGEDQPLVDQLVAIARPFLAYYAERPRLSAAMLQVSIFSTTLERDALDAQAYGFLDRVAERIERAKSRGELRADYDAQVFAMSFFALYLTTAIGGVQGLMPLVETQTAALHQMLTQLLAGGRV